MQVSMSLSQSMFLEEMVKHAANVIGPFPCFTGFINEIFNLLGEGVITYPKDSTLARGLEVDGAWLEGVGGIMNLLSHIKRIVNNRWQ